MQTISIYSLSELNEAHPEGFKTAYDRWCDKGIYDHGIAWQDETIDSLKALIEAAGAKLKNWSLGAYNRGNFISVDAGDSDDLTGKRAFAWLENRLLSALRVPWKGDERKRLRKYGAFYYAGLVEPCPFTGYCADDNYLDALRERIAKGDTVKEALESLADTCAKLLEDELQYQLTEEYFIEQGDANGWQFTEEGQKI